MSRWFVPTITFGAAVYLLGAIACGAKPHGGNGATPSPPPPTPAVATPGPPAEEGRPTLGVLLVVDQLRGDAFDRFGHLLDGGLARLTREGLVFEEAHFEHASTLTGPAHASLVTGASPSEHGVIANHWYDRRAGEIVSAVSDHAAMVYGGTHGISPVHMRVPTIGAWIKSAHPAARVVSISGKAPAAALMAGRKANAAFWYTSPLGAFTTSAFFDSELPSLLSWFGRAHPVDRFECERWERFEATSDRPEADPDNRPWEPEGASTFPHELPCKARKSVKEEEGDLLSTVLPPSLAREFERTPWFDEMTLDLAEAAVHHYRLGQDGAPDLLLLGLSGMDKIGHRYGPDSQEYLDALLQLDRRLGTFLELIEEAASPGTVVVALTSDHGVVSCPERDDDPSTARHSKLELERRLDDGLDQQFGEGNWVKAIANGHVYLDREGHGESREQIEDSAAALLSAEPAVARVYRRSELSGEEDPEDPFLPLMRAAWSEDHGGDLFLRFCEGCLLTDFATGTNHGSPYRYDTHVPLVLHGPGVEAGRSGRRVAVRSVAATLALLLGIDPPASASAPPLATSVP